MNTTIIIWIEQGREGVQMRLRAPHPLLRAGAVPRKIGTFQFRPEEVDRLRNGEKLPELLSTKDIQQRIRDWLLDDELRRIIREEVLKDASPSSVRLIFSVDSSLHDVPDIPLELLSLEDDLSPLIGDLRIASIVQQPLKAPAPMSVQREFKRPLRVLLVRSSPIDLDPVPKILPIRAELLQAQGEYVNSSMMVDVLSREQGEGVVGKPTADGLRATLENKNYDILVYFGHGEIEAGTGVLMLEDQEGRFPDSLTAGGLQSMLLNRPVRMALLVGCLTAAGGVNGTRSQVDEPAREMPGNQNIARSLIEQPTRVDVAVGMRYELEERAAVTFITTYFRSLHRNGGLVEAAIQEARRELVATDYTHMSWSAPAVYSREPREIEQPLFPFMSAANITPGPPGTASMEITVRDLSTVISVADVQGISSPQAQGCVGEPLFCEAVVALESVLRRESLATRDEFATLGKLLYRLIFNDGVGKQFREVYDQIGSQQRLLVRLVFDQQAAALEALPWEYLFCPPHEHHGGFFFTRGSNIDLVLTRYNPLGQEAREGWKAVDERLRILVVSTEPANKKKIDRSFNVATTMLESLKQLKERFPIDVEVLQIPTEGVLTARIDQVQPHIVHVISRGRKLGDTHEIFLADWHGAETLAYQLTSAASGWKPRLVFLQLCNGGKPPSGNFARLAPALLEKQVQAVIAMQYPIDLQGAKSFSLSFYPSLAHGDSIDKAIQDAMTEMLLPLDDPYTNRMFGTPVFYVQKPNRIIQPRGDARFQQGRTGGIDRAGPSLGTERAGADGSRQRLNQTDPDMPAVLDGVPTPEIRTGPSPLLAPVTGRQATSRGGVE